MSNKEDYNISEKKQRILNIAAGLFKERGYRATSMRELAKAVDLEPSSLYSHISSKEELLHLICLDCAERFLAGIEQIVDTNENPSLQITAVIHLHVEIAIENPTSFTVFSHEWKYLSQKHLEEFLNYRKQYEKKLQGIIVRGMQSGDFKQINSQIVLYHLLNSLRWIHLWYKPGRSVDPDGLSRDITSLIMEGLSKS